LPLQKVAKLLINEANARMIDFYEILEISPNASQEVIREVYKILLHRYNAGHDTEDRSEVQKLHQLNLAHDVLSDPDKRRLYDEEFGKAKTFQDEIARQHHSPVRTVESQAFDGQVNSDEDMALFKDKTGASNKTSILSRLKWNKWGWSVSILAVVAVLVSMVQPDPDKATRGQLAVQSHAEKKELKANVEKTATENQRQDSVENKETAK
jgi:curved DNA-binding protein CbpA